MKGAERDTFLAQACAGDTLLRDEIESLLRAHEESSDFLKSPMFEEAVELIANDEEPTAPPEQIGPYKIEKEIGRGGMGAVYLATRDDGEYRRQVALKIVKRGMDTDFILNRFRNERKTLAGFDHLNIARLWDGGATNDGLPYFAMEYVVGLPINEYCDRHRLSVAERLKLFRRVCAAVQYAHQRLVVHRDLKPGNILVTSEGVPKLLDFGIAKVLSPDGDTATMTALPLRAMTPEYASPEQLRGQIVTTASDVYSLGIILYELLTGQKPYQIDSRAPVEVVRAITEQPPTKPSTAVARGQKPEVSNQKLLRGDLDNIALKAMHLDPARRYGSVAEFSEDIRRYLDGLPVMARRDTFAYRAGKFVRRNKVAVGAAVFALATLIAGSIATAWEAHVARTHQLIAERRLEDVRKLAHTMLFDYNDAIKELRGATPVRVKLVNDALQYLDNLANQTKPDLALQRELAAAYEKVGDMQDSLGPSLGDTAGAVASYRKALAMRERLVALDRSDPSLLVDLASTYRNFARLLWSGNDIAAGFDMATKALILRKKIAEAQPNSLPARSDLVACYFDLAQIEGERGHFPESMQNFRDAAALDEILAAAEPANETYARRLPAIYSPMGETMLFTGDAAGAINMFRWANSMTERLAAAHPDSVFYHHNIALTNGRIGEAQAMLGDLKAALESFRKQLEIERPLADRDPSSGVFRQHVGNALFHIGRTLAQLGDLPGGRDNMERGLAIREELAKLNPTNGGTQCYLLENAAADALLLTRIDNDAAAEACRKTEALLQNARTDSNNMSQQEFRANAIGDLAEAHATIAGNKTASLQEQRNEWKVARNLYAKALDILRPMAATHVLSALRADKPEKFARAVARCGMRMGRARHPRSPASIPRDSTAQCTNLPPPAPSRAKRRSSRPQKHGHISPRRSGSRAEFSHSNRISGSDACTTGSGKDCRHRN
jgi:non-specific serine/threonine protein kinase/serine/threonine-protein kinase